MANRSKSPRRAVSRAAASAPNARALDSAQGRLHHGPPIAVIDIGSNSVRSVIYEGLTRAPTPIFNEKVLAGLGAGLDRSGRLPAEARHKALAALQRFRLLVDYMKVKDTRVVATAASRCFARFSTPPFMSRSWTKSWWRI